MEAYALVIIIIMIALFYATIVRRLDRMNDNMQRVKDILEKYVAKN